MKLTERIEELDAARSAVVKVAVSVTDLDEGDRAIAEHLFAAKFEKISDIIMVAMFEKKSRDVTGSQVN